MSADEPRNISSLRQVIEKAAAEAGCGLNDLTVLAAQNDPYRIDTDARHRDGAWLAVTAQDLGLGERKIHVRGLHYMVLGRPKPDGTPYRNDDDDWRWIENAAKAARWLGYIGHDQIIDQRNAAPVVRIFTYEDPRPYLTVGLDVEIPDADDIVPRVDIAGFRGVQPYKLVIFGEKSSLADVLGPIAEIYKADLYLPTGEISDTMMHGMARIGAEDGRPMVVFCFSDADPAGWQMPISISRKLPALKDLYGLDEWDFQVRKVALTPDQVREHGLPSTPLKATELRADKWRTAMGVDQTEIDALASLRPDLLRRIARDAIAPFYDSTLERRVGRAKAEWLEAAQATVDATVDADALDRLRADAEIKLAAMRQQIDEINDALQVDPADFTLPAPVVPTAVVAGAHGLPLVDSRMSFAEQSQRLLDFKAYRDPDRS